MNLKTILMPKAILKKKNVTKKLLLSYILKLSML